MPVTCKSWKRVLNPLQLELLIVGSCHVGMGRNETCPLEEKSVVLTTELSLESPACRDFQHFHSFLPSRDIDSKPQADKHFQLSLKQCHTCSWSLQDLGLMRVFFSLCPGQGTFVCTLPHNHPPSHSAV